MGTETNNNNNNSHCMSPVDTLNSAKNSPEYLAQLLKDKKQIENLAKLFPNPIIFQHTERLLDDEINKVRQSLFTINTGQVAPLALPDAAGPVVSLSEKMFVPQKDHPEFNFVGRILGPRGMTAKQLEQATGCKIMVRGRGSMRDKKKEEQNRGKPNWEHLSDELHVLITCEDTEDRSKVKLKRACDEIGRLLVPAVDGEDDLKKSQLMELAILNGTYRDAAKLSQLTLPPGMLPPGMLPPGLAPRIMPFGFPAAAAAGIRPAAAAPAGQPLFITQQPGAHSALRQCGSPVVSTAMVSMGNPPPLVSPDVSQAAAMAANGGFLYSPEMFPLVGLSSPAPMFDYTGLDMAAAAGAVKSVRPTMPVSMRAHPYQRLNMA